jgi:hypothetical protein
MRSPCASIRGLHGGGAPHHRRPREKEDAATAGAPRLPPVGPHRRPGEGSPARCRCRVLLTDERQPLELPPARRFRPELQSSPGMLTAACLASSSSSGGSTSQRRLAGRKLAAASVPGAAIVAACRATRWLTMGGWCGVTESSSEQVPRRTPSKGRLAWVHAADRIRWRPGGSLGSREH